MNILNTIFQTNFSYYLSQDDKDKDNKNREKQTDIEEHAHVLNKTIVPFKERTIFDDHGIDDYLLNNSDGDDLLDYKKTQVPKSQQANLNPR